MLKQAEIKEDFIYKRILKNRKMAPHTEDFHLCIKSTNVISFICIFIKKKKLKISEQYFTFALSCNCIKIVMHRTAGYTFSKLKD